MFLQKTAPTLPVIITKSLSRNQFKERPRSKVKISLQFSQFFWTKEPSVISISKSLLKNGLKQLFDKNHDNSTHLKYFFQTFHAYCFLLGLVVRACQLTFTCSKSTIETLVKGMKCIQS